MSPGEYDVEQELEFNRAQLQTSIPKRLQELYEIMDGHKESLEGWYFNLFTKILMSVGRVCHDLLKTTEQEALPAAAWNARNLLELWIWIKYCTASRENAWRFHEDALRDMQGLTESLSKMSELTGNRNEYVASARQKIGEVALAKLGLEAIDSSYTKVAEAAKSVGLESWYFPCNAHLSKFAHPTAGLVVGMMHQSEKLRDLQCVCTTQGVYFAGQCVIALEQIILAVPPT
jgi:hypothetical protein